MGLIKKVLGIGVLTLMSFGCRKDIKNVYIDLNGDKLNDFIYAMTAPKFRIGYMEYDFTVRFANHDGSYDKPKVLNKFKIKYKDCIPKMKLTDVDNDGDIDLVYHQRKNMWKFDEDIFTFENDGKGNFSK